MLGSETKASVQEFVPLYSSDCSAPTGLAARSRAHRHWGVSGNLWAWYRSVVFDCTCADGVSLDALFGWSLAHAVNVQISYCENKENVNRRIYCLQNGWHFWISWYCVFMEGTLDGSDLSLAEKPFRQEEYLIIVISKVFRPFRVSSGSFCPLGVTCWGEVDSILLRIIQAQKENPIDFGMRDV